VDEIELLAIMTERLASRIVAELRRYYEWKITQRWALDGPALSTTDGVRFGEGNADEENVGMKYAVTRR